MADDEVGEEEDKSKKGKIKFCFKQKGGRRDWNRNCGFAINSETPKCNKKFVKKKLTGRNFAKTTTAATTVPTDITTDTTTRNTTTTASSSTTRSTTIETRYSLRTHPQHQLQQQHQENDTNRCTLPFWGPGSIVMKKGRK